MHNQIWQKKKQMTLTGRVAASKRRKKTIDLPYLPREVIFIILSWLPAGFLHDIGKYVCKTWAEIICDPLFIETHLLRSNSGLLVKDRHKRYNARFLEAKEGKPKMVHLKRHFSAEVLASSEGVSLFLAGDYGYPVLYVANCVTMKELILPCLPSPICLSSLHRSRIGRIPDTGAFKVISPFVDLDGFYHWHVLTVGTDMSWRKILCGFTEDEFDFYTEKTFSICGVIYFANTLWMRNGSSILAVDLRDESIHYIWIPKEYLIEENYRPKAYGLLKTGNYLSFFVTEKNLTEVSIWILQNVYSNEWVKFRKIEVIVGSPIGDCSCTPFAWLDNGRILIFRKGISRGDKYRACDFSQRLIAYNLKTAVVTNIKNVETFKSHSVLVHTNSLVSW